MLFSLPYQKLFMRLPVSFSKEMNSTVDNLWELISSPGHLNLVHPFCKKNETLVWNNKNHEDVLVYLNGLRYEREFISWNKNKGFSLLIGESFGKKSKVYWVIESNNNRAHLTITVHPYLFDYMPKLIYQPLFFIIIRPMMKKYLISVLNGIDWYLDKKTPVAKNMFGKHLWFSRYWIVNFLFKNFKKISY